MRKGKKLLVVLMLVAISIVATVSLASCNSKEEDKVTLLNLSEVQNLETIQNQGDLTFEWLRNYNSTRPTMILFHGETTSMDRYSLELDSDEYTLYDSVNNETNFVLSKDSDGYDNSALDLDLAYYWLNVAQYNVAIFHWESFTYDDTNSISSKLYTVPKMRYRKEDGEFETDKVPKVALTELATNLYLKEMDGKKINKEIRFVGNGIGSNLALSITNLLDVYNENNLISTEYIPNRLALNDPYLTSENMYLSIDWDKNIDTTNGTLGLYNDMLTKVTDTGTVVEMIEEVTTVASTQDVVDENNETTQKTVYSNDYSYPMDRSTAKTKELFDGITSKLAYLKLSQDYSEKFSDKYIGCHRIALDWYLASVFGSDDEDIGYNIGSENNTNNGGEKNTRPILNDRKATDDLSSTAASYRGKNYGVSAWTPTVYTRALRGIRFSLKKYSSNATSDVHENMRYNYTDYIMNYFRTENYQKSDQTDYTLITGYVYLDSNADGFINDGATNGLGGETIDFEISTKEGKEIAKFSVKTAEDGFYSIKLADKVKDANGDLSTEGYVFNGTGVTMKLTYYITSNKYVYQKTISTGIYYNTIAAQNFSTEKCEFTFNGYYADAITVKNCLIRPEITDEE
ncbi:MAG: hypothetical protein WCR54_06545 [Clostridia bacterium]